MDAEQHEVMTLDQVAQYLQVSTRTVQRLIADGSLTGIKVGRQWRFRSTDVAAALVNLEHERQPAT